jgi:hypothetical protein
MCDSIDESLLTCFSPSLAFAAVLLTAAGIIASFFLASALFQEGAPKLKALSMNLGCQQWRF